MVDSSELAQQAVGLAEKNVGERGGGGKRKVR